MTALSLVFTSFLQSVPESFSESETFEADQAAEDDANDKDSDVDSDDAFDDVNTGVLIEDDGDIPQYEMEDLSDFESQGSDSQSEGDPEDGQEVKSPLFLQLTCSLKNTSSHGQLMTPVSINTLPVCLGKNKRHDILSHFLQNYLQREGNHKILVW